MEFKLNEYHRNVPDEELIEDLKRVAGIHQKSSITQKEYLQYGKYASRTIVMRFGSWNEALKKAGLVLERGHYKTHLFCESDEDFFEDVQAVATQLGRNYVSIEEYAKYGKYSHGSKVKKYKSWDAILHESGLENTPFRTGPNLKYSDEELFEEMERLWVQLGHQPSVSDAKLYNGARISGTTFQNRFGSWRKALEAFVEYINTDDMELLNDTADEDKNNDNPNENEISPYKHKTKREPSNRLKVQVLMRDGNRCRICGVACNDGIHKIHFDHIIPWSKGGETTLDNLQVLCSDCNEALGNLDK